LLATTVTTTVTIVDVTLQSHQHSSNCSGTASENWTEAMSLGRGLVLTAELLTTVTLLTLLVSINSIYV